MPMDSSCGASVTGAVGGAAGGAAAGVSWRGAAGLCLPTTQGEGVVTGTENMAIIKLLGMLSWTLLTYFTYSFYFNNVL